MTDMDEQVGKGIDAESIGLLVDTCDNYLAGENNLFLSDSMKHDMLLTGMRDVRKRLHALVVGATGYDEWADA